MTNKLTKKIQLYGNAYIIRFDALEREVLNLNVGDIVEIELFKVKKKKK